MKTMFIEKAKGLCSRVIRSIWPYFLGMLCGAYLVGIPSSMRSTGWLIFMLSSLGLKSIPKMEEKKPNWLEVGAALICSSVLLWRLNPLAHELKDGGQSAVVILWFFAVGGVLLLTIFAGYKMLFPDRTGEAS
jgi:hypothetical protein